MPDGTGYSVVEASPAYSDDALALAFSSRHDGQLLYVPAWASWLRWDGCRWLRDDTLHVFDLVRALCRDIAAQAEADEKDGGCIARGLTSAGTIAAVERLARSDPRHARRAEAFDADPWALNTPGGVIDLRTGKMRPHRKDDLFTKATSVTQSSSSRRRWIRFLLEITHGDRLMVRYLQRFIGYTLTGIIEEHAFAFLCGPGGNGKSVLLATVADVLGDYATTAMADVFTASRNDQHPTHLASLRGARLVAVTETEEGRPWAESRIKALTGGDRISARVMRGDPFEFSPVFKLWIAGNHRPVLRNPDPAMRRRLHLMPFTFVPIKPDLKLMEALRVEREGILQWAVEGCLAWQKKRLKPPKVVTEATDEYFEEQDSLAAWVAERCERKPLAVTPSRAMFADWKKWTETRGEEAGTEKRFAEGLQRHAAKKRTNSGMVFMGLKLKPLESGAW